MSAAPYKPIQSKPPSPEMLGVPRAGWAPPRRRPEDVPDSLQYQGHYRPSQFMPNYGNKLESEVGKARGYYEQNLKGQPGIPRLEHNRIQRTFPTYNGPLSSWAFMGPGGAGSHLYAAVKPNEESARKMRPLVGHAPGIITSPNRPRTEKEKAEISREMGPPSVRTQINGLPADYPPYSTPFDPESTQHEMRHAWTLGDDPEIPGMAESPLGRLLDTKVKYPKMGISDDSALERIHPGASHGLLPSEQMGWLSGLQHELFKQQGSRLESPEEAENYMRGMLALPDDEFEAAVSDFDSDSARGLRHLRILQNGVPQEVIDSGQVTPSTEPFRYREGVKSLPKWLGGKELPFTGEVKEMPNAYQQGKEVAPEVLEQYIQWLSKLAPALVSTQNGDQQIMKTASEPIDMTKAAGLQELLSGAGNFINNMPNNPTWQNAGAGAGGGALLMILLNLLTGGKMSRGILPAMLAGGALGGGAPHLYNYMNQQGAFGGSSPAVAPPQPEGPMGPPAPKPEEMERRRVASLSPLARHHENRTNSYDEGTLGRDVAAPFMNAWETIGANATKPFRSLYETGRTLKDKGLMTPTNELFRDPLTNARPYSDTNP